MLKADPDNAGHALGVTIDANGNPFATGVSVFPLIKHQANAKRSFTVIQFCRDRGKFDVTPCP
jgi:hypothetical protein